ncbi:helix-hairpin-helix motif domain-containing protein [Cardiosporidium cionae]|uniref:Adenine DNA glycosylase n=1 Tax=Cardiosporidium cionae TaxID=476202 RepID=A0ABQ7JDM9_9APIC|nr:helix-hairpin-helix motif domain-containing protein [Cardiosporidium cionae]|eukprot:KAF8822110.1 helix-hairpin-helix motif domain-containing protein [Cardiosporidium cionae]
MGMVAKTADAVKNSALRNQAPTVYHALRDGDVPLFQKNLLNWYDTHRRKLPWRGDLPPFTSWVETRQSTSKTNQTSLDTFFKQKQKEKPNVSSSPLSRNSDIENLGAMMASIDKAYAVWVSEVMLQQTQVTSVIPYWMNWIKRWPDVCALSKASFQEVYEHWAGLGYYNRAKHLLEGAQYIMKEFHGKIPRNEKDLLRIPGIGKYTAGAIRSIAFNIPSPAVDGNVIRVISRLVGFASLSNSTILNSHITKISSAVKNKSQNVFQSYLKLLTVLQLALQWVPSKRPGDFNQALMELGATICSVTNPLCKQCPVQSHCRILQESQHSKFRKAYHPSESCDICDATRIHSAERSDEYPLPKITKVRPHKHFVAAIVQRISPTGQTEIFLRKRPSEGLLSNQWEPPNVEIENTDTFSTEERIQVEMECSKYGLSIKKNEGFRLMNERVVATEKIKSNFMWVSVDKAEVGATYPVAKLLLVHSFFLFLLEQE